MNRVYPAAAKPVPLLGLRGRRAVAWRVERGPQAQPGGTRAPETAVGQAGLLGGWLPGAGLGARRGADMLHLRLHVHARPRPQHSVTLVPVETFTPEFVEPRVHCVSSHGAFGLSR